MKPINYLIQKLASAGFLLVAAVLGLTLTVQAAELPCGNGKCMNGMPWNTQGSWSSPSCATGKCIQIAQGCSSTCRSYTATQYLPDSFCGGLVVKPGPAPARKPIGPVVPVMPNQLQPVVEENRPVPIPPRHRATTPAK